MDILIFFIFNVFIFIVYLEIRGVSTHYHPAMPFENINISFRGSFQFRIVAFKKKYHSNEKLKFNNLGIF